MATYKSIKYVIPVEAVEHTDSINALSDVDTVTTPPSDYQILVWSAADSKWYPGYVEEPAGTQKALFGFGYANGNSGNNYSSGYVNITNLVSSTGVVATDTAGVGSARSDLAASGYGGDKAIFGFGLGSGSGYSMNYYNLTNLVSNTGVVSTDTTGVGSIRNQLAAASYGGDKAIFGFGGTTVSYNFTETNVTNLVSNAGVVASDTTGVGTAQYGSAASGYGGDKAIFAFGQGPSTTNRSNLVSNIGVVSTDITGVGQSRMNLAAATYGGDKAIYGYGWNGSSGGYNMTNLVSNTGVVATDITGVGTSRNSLAAAGYGGDKAIFGFGSHFENYTSNQYNLTNLVSNTGVVSSDVTGVGTARYGVAGAGFSSTA